MKLYQNPLSPPCRRVLATAYELDMPLELISVDFNSGELMKNDYLKMNPNSTIPLLVDGDFSLWESTAIMQYLADKKGSGLYPQDLKQRAEVNRWSAWSMNHFSRATGTFVWENIVKQMMNMGASDPAALKQAEVDFHKFAKVMDQQLAANHFITGKNLTLADFSLGSDLMYADYSKLPWGNYKNIQAWYMRLETTKGWKNSTPPKA